MFITTDYNSPGKVGLVVDAATTTGGQGIRVYSSGSHGVEASSSSPYNAGVVATHSVNGHGVYARATGNGVSALYGDCGGNACSYAAFLNGPVHVTGYLTKAGGGFKIDHPADPTGKYLVHSFVESPDMKNFYDGIATLDAAGKATVPLPAYFERLNSDFRYQLTPMGQSASLYISREIVSGSFEIAGGRPGQRVSWAVTGIRQDAFARLNRLPDELAKPTEALGRYLNPEAFGKPETQRELADRTPKVSPAGPYRP